jgi:hypothetical protein
VVALAVVVSARGAAAAPSEDARAAREAFSHGTEAHARGDDAEAAAEFARADALKPNPIALEAGLKSAIMADRPDIGMTLVQRAEERGAIAPSLSVWVETARKKFEQRVGRVEIRCVAPGCVAIVDGLPAAVHVTTFLASGEHVVELGAGGRLVRIPVHVVGGEKIVVEPPRGALGLPPIPPPLVESRSGASPTWFFVALGVTAVAGGFTIASGVDTAEKHAAYERDMTTKLSGPGQTAETRTNVLIGVTGALALATAGVGLFAVRWKTPARAVEPARAAPGVWIALAGPGGAILGRF